MKFFQNYPNIICLEKAEKKLHLSPSLKILTKFQPSSD